MWPLGYITVGLHYEPTGFSCELGVDIEMAVSETNAINRLVYLYNFYGIKIK